MLPGASTQHLEYVFMDGSIDVYDADNGFKAVKHISIPTTDGVRGVVGYAPTHILYISHGSDGNSGGSLLAYDLLTDKVLWNKSYAFGIDSHSLTPDGKLIYMPDGETASAPYWYVINAADGSPTGAKINGGSGPHNTVVSLNGFHVYMGARNFSDTPTYLTVADTTSNGNIRTIGPFKSGVRPFTINSTETLAFVTTTGFLGFQVADLQSGKILYTVDLTQLGFSNNTGGAVTAPSHGIALSPDEKTIAVIDWPNDSVHFFDVSGLPASAPKKTADSKFTRSIHHNEAGCAYDCAADGWLEYSRDGRYLYVGDVGDVVNTVTNTVVTNLPALYNTRKMIEVDFQNGAVSYVPINRASTGFGGANPTPSGITPTWNCLVPQGCTTGAPTPTVFQVPTASITPPSPSETTLMPSIVPSTSISPSPCASSVHSVTVSRKQSKHSNRTGGVVAIAKKLLTFILKLLTLILQLLGIHQPPPPHNPPCNPLPTPISSTLPTQIQSPSSIPQNTLAPSLTRSQGTPLPTQTQTYLLPGQQMWKNAVSSYIFGMNSTYDYYCDNLETDPHHIFQPMLKTTGITLIRTFFSEQHIGCPFNQTKTTDADIDARLNAIKNIGAQCLGVIAFSGDPTYASSDTFIKHLVSYAGSRCNMYELGNEPFTNLSMQQYLAGWNRLIPQLRAINPQAKFGGPVSSGYYEPQIQAFLQGAKASGVLPDFVTYHDYPCYHISNPSSCDQQVQTVGQHIAAAKTVVKNILGISLPIGVTEWNVDPDFQQTLGLDPTYMPHFVTEMVNAMVQNGLSFANYFDAANGGGAGNLDIFNTNANDQPRPWLQTFQSLITRDKQ